MNDDRITELARTVAAATAAGENEKVIPHLEALSEEENEAVAALAAKIFTKNTSERISELFADFAAARDSQELVDAVIDAASLEERRYLVHLALNQAELLKERIASRLDYFPGIGGRGSFLFRTAAELRRVVELSARATLNDLMPAEKRLSAEGCDPWDGEIAGLLAAAEGHAADQNLIRGLRPVALSTHWSLKLGFKTHAALVASDCGYAGEPGGYATLCGRGKGWGWQLNADMRRVNCKGCSNALWLGGFLPPTDTPA